MITRYGIDVVIKCLIITIAIFLLALIFLKAGAVQYIILTVTIVALILVINFFRDPSRSLPDGKDLIISPADGKIVAVKEKFDSEYLQQDAIQISIFMSPLDVHVNRFPISGKVSYFQHFQGEHMVAFNDKSSEVNERTHIGIDNNGYKVLFKQIAGTVARRIITDVFLGQEAVQGQRFGMIRFGSRVDVIFPKGTTLKAAINDRVKAGETILAQHSTTTRGIS